MDFLAKLGAMIALLVAPLFGGLGFFDHSQISVSQVSTESATTTMVAKSNQWVLLSTMSVASQNECGYSLIGNQVFHGGSSEKMPGKPIPSAKAAVFEVYRDNRGICYFAKDQSNVYIDSAVAGADIISGADPDSFGVVEDNGEPTEYEVDKYHVYDTGIVVPNADPSSFIYLGSVVDQNTGEFQTGDYAVDKNYVYFDGTQNNTGIPAVVSGADPATFHLLGSSGSAVTKSCGGDSCFYDSEDKNHKYLAGQVVQ